MSFIQEPLSLIPILIRRKIGEIDVNVILNENATDNLVVTKQPVQTGASITDHAYKEPTTFNMAILFRYNLTKSLKKIYQELLDLQNSRVPFAVVTPKRIYSSVLITSISQTTDKRTENCLAINIQFQEIIIVKLSTAQVNRSQQANPGATGATENAGRKQPQSALSRAFGG
jgi:hypothetical protein